ncbi:YggS family pyridoxal phosphate-dependent enzyme [Chloroflexota bacterium]
MIRKNVCEILASLPPGVELVAAVKQRYPGEIIEAVRAGVSIIGENYVQEAEEACAAVGNGVRWHFIGRLQSNKVGRAVRIFDMIQTVDSLSLAAEIDEKCRQIGKVMPVLIEVNSGREKRKSGVLPESLEHLIEGICDLHNINIQGIMTIGPLLENPDRLRPFFADTRRLFEQIRDMRLPGVEMRYLSMGMTDSYKIALEEGANMVRIGTRIFGERPEK